MLYLAYKRKEYKSMCDENDNGLIHKSLFMWIFYHVER